MFISAVFDAAIAISPPPPPSSPFTHSTYSSHHTSDWPTDGASNSTSRSCTCNYMAGDFQIVYDGSTDARAAGHGAACAAAAARRHSMHAEPQPSRGLLIKPQSALKSNVTCHSSQMQWRWRLCFIHASCHCGSGRITLPPPPVAQPR